MDLKNAHYFDSDPDWSRFSSERGYTLKQPPYAPVTIDIEAGREAQRISEGEWETSHPLRDVGYSSRTELVQVRDGASVEIKISRSMRVDAQKPLPLLFVTHGGGFVKGTHVTEEAWLLWPLLQGFDLVVVSVGYRRAPEHKAPTYINDCWDVLQNIAARADELCFDPRNIILTGSSAGAGIAASLSQLARDHREFPVQGILLNVPVLCDYRHFPKEKYEYSSYEQCMGTLLGGGDMNFIWDKVVPDDQAGRDPLISPFLGDLQGLPPHAIFVAGQDPLRDEGVAYAEKLKSSGVATTMHVYQGVPHTFAEFWELNATQKFWGGVRASMKEMLSG